MEIRLIHLSDLHLADDFAMRSVYRRRWWRNPPDQALMNSLADVIRGIAPHYVVISGDLVNKCSAKTFKDAAATLKALLVRAGVDINTKVLIIPGNHDVKVIAKDDEYFGRVKEFVHFLKQFFGEGDYRSRTERFTLVDRATNLYFICLDSTLKKSAPLAEGEVGPAQWQWLAKKNEVLRALHTDLDQFIKIVVLHHHPHPIGSSGSDRFMQLLDQGEAIKNFETIGANIVLHGHKHYPHVLSHSYRGASDPPDAPMRHYTVVGAGTACCRWLEEQAGEGNNFNYLLIKPKANMLELRRYKADNNKVFQNTATFGPFPLSRPSPRGYRILEYHTSTVIKNSGGDVAVTDRRKGLVVDSSAGNGRRQIAFGFGGLAETAEIVEFQANSGDIEEVKFETNLRHERKGYFVLRRPLSWGGVPIDLEYTCTIRRGMLMKRKSGEGPDHERAILTVAHPCDKITLDVQFPADFTVTPQLRVRNENLEPQDPNPSTEKLVYDDSANRHTLTVLAPKFEYEYSLVWKLP